MLIADCCALRSWSCLRHLLTQQTRPSHSLFLYHSTSSPVQVWFFPYSNLILGKRRDWGGMSINRSPSLLLLFKSNSHRFFPTSTSRIGSTLALPSTRSRSRTRAVSTLESGPFLRCYSSTSNPKSKPSSNPNRRRLPSLILSTSLAITLFFTFDHYLNHRIAQRNIYTIATGALIAADFKWVAPYWFGEQMKFSCKGSVRGMAMALLHRLSKDPKNVLFN